MALAHSRELGPGIRRAIGNDQLVEVRIDEGVALLRPQAQRAVAVLHQRPPDTAHLLDEIDRLLWMDGRAGAPDLIATGRADTGDEAAVIHLSAAATPASIGHPLGPEQLVETVASVLRDLHTIPIDRCPFDAGVAVLRALVADRLRRNQISRAEEGPYAGHEPSALVDLLDNLLAALDEATDAVVMIHASMSADHVWFDPDGGVVLTGWRRAGVGDRHADLAAAAAIVTELHGPALVAPLLDAYGLEDVDLRRLDAHQLLHHLVR